MAHSGFHAGLFALERFAGRVDGKKRVVKNCNGTPGISLGAMRVEPFRDPVNNASKKIEISLLQTNFPIATAKRLNVNSPG